MDPILDPHPFMYRVHARMPAALLWIKRFVGKNIPRRAIHIVQRHIYTGLVYTFLGYLQAHATGLVRDLLRSLELAQTTVWVIPYLKQVISRIARLVDLFRRPNLLH